MASIDSEYGKKNIWFVLERKNAALPIIFYHL